MKSFSKITTLNTNLNHIKRHSSKAQFGRNGPPSWAINTLRSSTGLKYVEKLNNFYTIMWKFALSRAVRMSKTCLRTAVNRRGFPGGFEYVPEFQEIIPHVIKYPLIMRAECYQAEIRPGNGLKLSEGRARYSMYSGRL